MRYAFAQTTATWLWLDLFTLAQANDNNDAKELLAAQVA